MYLAVIFFPLISSFLVGFFGRFIGHRGVKFFSPTILFLTFFLSLFIFYEIALCQSVCSIRLFYWVSYGSVFFYWGFYFDTVTVVMLVVITSISAFVHLYSVEYMATDPHFARFISYLSLFTFFMLMLVTGDNYVQLFLGWEGVGLCSFLLIGFWFTRKRAVSAAIKAIVVNRVGDFGLFFAIAFLYAELKTFNFSEIFALAPSLLLHRVSFLGFSFPFLDTVCFLLFFGAIGKSAQIGLHTWLPDAMEGPTPVSALIHAATMVTAGVFLIIRSSPLFEYTFTVNFIVMIVGALTAFFAASVGLFQNDIKRVIAYSTCSQLGYMVFVCGLSNYSVGLFHLFNHSFFKALLFLSAGVVIHALADEQDMRKMGGLLRLMPFTYLMILVGSLSLMGFPFLTGYYSKDLILELAGSSYFISATFGQWLGTLAAFFTAFYSTRLLYFTFLSSPNGSRIILENVHDAPFFMMFPMVALFFGAIFVGFITRDMFVGLGTDFWGQSIVLNTLFSNSSLILSSEFLPVFIKLMPVFFSLVGSLVAFFSYHLFRHILVNFKMFNFFGYWVYSFLIQKWYFDVLYNNFIVVPILKFGYFVTFKYLDKGIFELIGPMGLIRFSNFISSCLSNFHSGFIYHYIFIITTAIVFFFFYSVFSIGFNFYFIAIMFFLVFWLQYFDFGPKDFLHLI